MSGRDDSAAVAEPPRLIVTRSHQLPAGCGPRAVGSEVLLFLASLNRGDQSATSKRFAEPGFQWFVVGGPKGRTFLTRAYELDSLPDYLAGRHEHDESWQLIELRVNSAGVLRDVDGTPIPPTLAANVEMRLTRSADDLDVGVAEYAGKAILACGTGVVVMWTTGPNEARSARPLCPSPSGGPTTNAAIVCAYR
jgi:hypothetical protein